MKKFIGLVTIMLLGRAYDAYATYLYIPDLHGEVNPISSLLGGGWTSLLITQAVLIAVVIACMYYYQFRFKAPLPPSSALGFRQYISFLNFNNTNSFNKIFYSVPANKHMLAASLGYVVSRTLICISYIVGISTTLLIVSDNYRILYKHGGPVVLITIAAVVAVFFYYRFYKIQYRRYFFAA